MSQALQSVLVPHHRRETVNTGVPDRLAWGGLRQDGTLASPDIALATKRDRCGRSLNLNDEKALAAMSHVIARHGGQRRQQVDCLAGTPFALAKAPISCATVAVGGSTALYSSR
jgi:hypothetical protein